MVIKVIKVPDARSDHPRNVSVSCMTKFPSLPMVSEWVGQVRIQRVQGSAPPLKIFLAPHNYGIYLYSVIGRNAQLGCNSKFQTLHFLNPGSARADGITVVTLYGQNYVELFMYCASIMCNVLTKTYPVQLTLFPYASWADTPWCIRRYKVYWQYLNYMYVLHCVLCLQHLPVQHNTAWNTIRMSASLWLEATCSYGTSITLFLVSCMDLSPCPEF